MILENNNTIDTLSCFVSGRQFSILGVYNPICRKNTLLFENISVNSLTPINIFNLGKNSNGLGCGLTFKEIEIYSTTDQIIYIYFNTDLLNSNFLPISDVETILLKDTSSTSCTNGINIWSSIIQKNKLCISNLECLPNVTNFENISFKIKGRTEITGTVDIVLRYLEEW